MVSSAFRLPVSGSGPERHPGDRERPAADQQSQAGGGEPGQETAGAGHGDPGTPETWVRPDLQRSRPFLHLRSSDQHCLLCLLWWIRIPPRWAQLYRSSTTWAVSERPSTV